MDKRILKVVFTVIALFVVCFLMIMCFVHQMSYNKDQVPFNETTKQALNQYLIFCHGFKLLNNTPTVAPTDSQHIICNGTRKDNLLHYLNRTSGSKTITGLFAYENHNIDKGLDNIKKATGVLPGILTTNMPQYSAGENEWQSFIDDTISKWNKGYLIHILRDIGENPLKSIDMLKNENDTDWFDLITEGVELVNEWKKELDALATYLKQLETAGVVPICEFLRWNNLERDAWGGSPGINGSQRLYQMTHDYLTNHHNLSSLIWSWSLHTDGNMTELEDYWPGNNYVDVVSVYVKSNDQPIVSANEYGNILDVVGDKPISLERVHFLPRPELLASQTRWTWFTVDSNYLANKTVNSAENINATFHDPSVINKGNPDFFETINCTQN